MTNANWLIIIVVIIAAGVFGGWYLSARTPSTQPPPTPQSTDMTPPPISTPQPTHKNADANVIVVDMPKAGGTATSTLLFPVRRAATGILRLISPSKFSP